MYYAYGGVGSGVVFFLLGIVLTIPVIFKMNRMLGAINRADIAALKKLSSVGWEIIALVFSGVIPDIMLLVADGRIKSLGQQGGVVDQSGAAQLDKIAKLKSLLDSGAITQQEFDEQKKKFLSQA